MAENVMPVSANQATYRVPGSELDCANTEEFDFAGRKYVIRCKRLDGTNLDFILSEDRKGNDAMAQGYLVSRVLHSIFEDGKEIKKWRVQPDGSGGFPVRFDLDTGETLGKRVTREIVRHNPYLIKLAKGGSFGEFEEDFEDEEEEAQDPTAATPEPSPPTHLRRARGGD
jgi:hypothetical protein